MYDTGLVRIEDMNGTWVETLRTQARGRVSSLQVPTYKNENYRFTSVKDISWDRSPQALSALPPLPVHLTQASPGEVGVVAVRSGHATGCTEKMASSEHLKSLLAQGVIFTDLLSLLKDSNARALAVLKNH